MTAKRRLILPLLCLCAGAAAPLVAQAVRGNSGLRGTVLDMNGRPVPGARLYREGGGDTAIADSLGRFALERLALGRHLFVVERAGYVAISFEVTFTRDTVLSGVDIPLEAGPGGAAAGAAGPGGLPGKLESMGFIERRRTTPAGAQATFVGPEDITTRSPVRVSQLFEGMRGVTVRIERGNVVVVYGHDGRCVMNVWLDGVRSEGVFPPGGMAGAARARSTSQTRYPGLDELVPIAQVGAIEVFPIPSQVPQRFQYSGRMSSDLDTRDGANCGAIVIWTR